MTPVAPAATLSVPVGLNCENCPYLVWYGLSIAQRTPRFSVRVGLNFQSSCAKKLLMLSRGSQLAVGTANVELETEPSMNPARLLVVELGFGIPVFGQVLAPVRLRLAQLPARPAAVSKTKLPLGVPRL